MPAVTRRPCASYFPSHTNSAWANGFAEGFLELFVLDLAKRGLALLGENFGNREASGVRNTAIEVNVNPADLPHEQARDGGFAAAHETCQAEKFAGPWNVGERRVVVSGVQRDAALFALVNVDCTIE